MRGIISLYSIRYFASFFVSCLSVICIFVLLVVDVAYAIHPTTQRSMSGIISLYSIRYFASFFVSCLSVICIFVLLVVDVAYAIHPTTQRSMSGIISLYSIRYFYAFFVPSFNLCLLSPCHTYFSFSVFFLLVVDVAYAIHPTIQRSMRGIISLYSIIVHTQFVF